MGVVRVRHHHRPRIRHACILYIYNMYNIIYIYIYTAVRIIIRAHTLPTRGSVSAPGASAPLRPSHQSAASNTRRPLAKRLPPPQQHRTLAARVLRVFDAALAASNTRRPLAKSFPLPKKPRRFVPQVKSRQTSGADW